MIKRKLNFTAMSCVCGRVLTITTLTLCVVNHVIAEIPNAEATGNILPVSDDQQRFLAKEVCYSLAELQLNGSHIYQDNCIKAFLGPPSNMDSNTSNVHLICRSQNRAMFNNTAAVGIPAVGLQLVVLIFNDSEIRDYNILNLSEDMPISSFEIDSSNYTFWTSALQNNGTHSSWLRGPDLPAWSKNPENFKIKIEEPMIEFNKKSPISKHGSYKVDAVFEIKFNGELNPCSTLQIMNVCDKLILGDFFEKTIKPTPHTTITIEDIPSNDNCVLSIYENSDLLLKKKYQSIVKQPKNYQKKNQGSVTHIPEKAKNISLEAVANDDVWDIHVSWSRPAKDPEKYNLTLRAPGVLRSAVAAGIATKFTFERVVGEEWALYNVSIKSISKNISVQTSRRAQFPVRTNYQAVIVTGSWSLVLTVAAVVLGAVVWWRRRKALAFRQLYFPSSEYKLPKECMTESCSEAGVDDPWELRAERLLLHEVIGEGAFGVVRRGTLTPASREVAVKMLKDFPTVEEIRSFRAEMELMKSVGVHAHIVSLVGCCSRRRPLIVAEYCSRGDLLSFLRCSWDVMVSKRNAKYYNNNLEDKLTPLVVNKLYDLQGICDAELTALDLLSFCRQIAMGMEFLASNRVVHRDLAARNILVTADRTLKIADFGLSRDVYQENQYKQKGNGKMPVKWMALESLTRRIYTTQSDVWSFGVVVWEIVTVGGAPYPDVPAARLPRLLRAGYRMPRPNNCSKQLYDLMMSCWRARPRDRPTFADLHHTLDELLNNACADEYLSLELDYEPPSTPKPQKYIRMLLKGNRVWTKGESYERPFKGNHYSSASNHYTSPPAPVHKIQVV